MERLLNLRYEMDEELVKGSLACEEEASAHLAAIKSGTMDYTGWVNYASELSEASILKIERMAEDIRNKSTCFVSIGIGGSYLGAKAALDFIGGGLNPAKGRIGAPRVEFAGFNMSGAWHDRLIKSLEGEELCICQISKSGRTVEPHMAFLALRERLIKKYGKKEADARTYAVTDPVSGDLREEAIANHWEALSLPSDIGGRFSVLTPVGLLPLAVAGIDIRALVKGAAMAEKPEFEAEMIKLAGVRHSIYRSGKSAELIGCFDPSVESFIAWIVQLFGESEGKDGKGMLPCGMSLSRDLHSLGQFMQDGSPVFSEILIDIKNPPGDRILNSGGKLYSGRGMNEFNRAVLEGTIRAHRQAGNPIICLGVRDQSPEALGFLIRFLEMTCAITGMLLGVDPFNQPGVESYKKEMMNILNKGRAL